ncbi:MAG: SAM-dependent methyltransferase [Parachlamydiaceae bacterium]
MNNRPTLLLLPNLLGDYRHAEVFLPVSVFKAMQSIDGLIAESDAEGRRYLKRFETKKKAADIPIALFNEHTVDTHLDFLLEPIVAGERWGLVSDAGLPCIADPGSKLVLRAIQRGIHIQAFVGPSSILFALMLSGLPGQKFFFHGYLEKSPDKRKEQIKQLAHQSQKENATQLFIEAPYRNVHTLDTLLQTLPDHAWLCVAWDLTLPTQGVMTQRIAQWKKCSPPNIDKKPTIFLMNTAA